MIRQLKPYQLAVDLSVAGLFGLLLVTTTFADGVPGVVVLVGMAVALGLRRLSPGIALAVAWMTVVVQLLSGMQAVLANAAILAVLYATAAYGGRVVRWLGLASACGGGVIAAVYTTLILYAQDVTIGTPSVLVFTSVLGSVAGVFVLGLSWTVGLLVRTSREARVVSIQRYQALQEQRAAQQAVVVEQERNRIARDMHDVVAHSLAVVIAQADGARYVHKGKPEQLDATLATIADTARAALGDVRLLLSELRHRQGDGPQPVIADLEPLIEQMRAAGLAIDVREYGQRIPLPAGHQIALYRIVQEALTNALRHGDASEPVILELWWMPQGASLRVTNAVQEHRSEPRQSLGHGLPGMRERAELAGGWLSIDQPDGDHFVVSGFLPTVVPGGQPTVSMGSSER